MVTRWYGQIFWGAIGDRIDGVSLYKLSQTVRIFPKKIQNSSAPFYHFIMQQTDPIPSFLCSLSLNLAITYVG